MIVLDTHIWLWWVNQDIEKLSPARMKQIELSELVAVSAISCFEVAWLARHDRIVLPCHVEVWFEKALTGSGVSLLPITPVIAAMAVALPEHHSDPQDRMIIATALVHDANLMSSDRKLPTYADLAGRLL